MIDHKNVLFMICLYY